MANKTKPNEPKPDETVAEVFRNSEFQMLEEEYNRMITEWLKTHHVKTEAAILKDITTNIPPRKVAGGEKRGVLFIAWNSR